MFHETEGTVDVKFLTSLLTRHPPPVRTARISLNVCVYRLPDQVSEGREALPHAHPSFDVDLLAEELDFLTD
jgi:hypothetical protein